MQLDLWSFESALYKKNLCSVLSLNYNYFSNASKSDNLAACCKIFQYSSARDTILRYHISLPDIAFRAGGSYNLLLLMPQHT